MNPMKDTGPANGTLILSLPPSKALSGLNKDKAQNPVVPRNNSPMRTTCAEVLSLASLIRSGESLRGRDDSSSVLSEVRLEDQLLFWSWQSVPVSGLFARGCEDQAIINLEDCCSGRGQGVWR
jgi:hypothetical protein